jgi:hypothetical protein
VLKCLFFALFTTRACHKSLLSIKLAFQVAYGDVRKALSGLTDLVKSNEGSQVSSLLVGSPVSSLLLC